MPYEIVWSDEATKDFSKLQKPMQKRIANRLEFIANDPFLFVKHLMGVSVYSLRIGDYRLILSIERKKLIILVMKIRHRSKVYNEVK